MIEEIKNKIIEEIDQELGATQNKSFSIFKGIDPEFHKQVKSFEGREKRQNVKFEKVAQMINNQEHLKDPEKFKRFLKRNKINVEFQ